MIKGDRFIDGKEAIIIGRANPSEIAIFVMTRGDRFSSHQF
jgi:hypothetical protein